MPSPDLSRVLDWSKTVFPSDSQECVSDLPWAQVFKLQSGQQRAWLKIYRNTELAHIEKIVQIHQLTPVSSAAIMAHQRQLRAILFADHGGTSLADHAHPHRLQDVLFQYGAVQDTLSAAHSVVLENLPPIALETTLSRLDAFLRADESTDDGLIPASPFIGHQRACAYGDLFRICAPLLQPYISGAQTLPVRVCHGDLHAGNLARRADGTFIFLDWDEAQPAPIGTYLDALMPKSVNLPLGLHQGVPALMDTMAPYFRRFDIDIATNREHCQAAIGAVLVGILEHVMSFGHHQPFHDETTQAAGQSIATSLDGVLAFCNVIGAQNTVWLQDVIPAYAANGYMPYALSLMQNIDTATIFGASVRDRHKPAQYRQTVAHLERVDTARRTAEMPQTVPHMDLTPWDLQNPSFRYAAQQTIQDLLNQYGVIALLGLMDRDRLQRIQEHIDQSYVSRLRDDTDAGTFKVGDKRLMITPSLFAPLADDTILLPELLTPVLSNFLGSDYKIGSVSLVTSLPGAADQWRHRDHPPLFPEQAAHTTPEFAINMIVPLISLTDTVGTTCVAKGSHRIADTDDESLPMQRMDLPLGSALLFSNRLVHGGMANTSKMPRPILSINFHRIWFQDQINFPNLPPIRVSPDNLAHFPERLRERLRPPHAKGSDGPE